MIWLAFVLLFQAPFWEAKASVDWTQAELVQMFTDSPWAQALSGPANAPPVAAFFATAGPIEQAELEREHRYKKKGPQTAPDLMAEEYRAWLVENRATQIVLAIPIGDAKAFADNQDTQRMESDSVMRVGRKKIKMTGHFPPSATDPYLRLAFPRQVTVADKTVSFDLFLPGITMPFRTVEFHLKDMVVKGKLEI